MSEIETETQQTRVEVAATLRQMADELDRAGPVTLGVGNRLVTLDPTDPVTVKLEAESDWSPGETEAKQSVEVGLVWGRPATTAEEAALSVEESTG